MKRDVDQIASYDAGVEVGEKCGLVPGGNLGILGKKVRRHAATFPERPVYREKRDGASLRSVNELR